MFLKVNFYFLFIFILGYLGGSVFSPYVYAAMVVTVNQQQAALNTKPAKTLSEEKHQPPSHDKFNSLYYPSSTILYSTFTQIPNPVAIKSRPLQQTSQKKNENKVNLFPNLYTQTKDFLIQNKGNKTVKNALLVFGQTRQFLKETDLMLHNLTQNILLSLNLDSPNLKNLIISPQDESSMNTKLNSSPYSASTNYKQQIEITKLQSLSQQQNLQKFGYSDNELFALIFNLQNLFYLAGVFICFLIVKQLVKFALIKDKFDSQNRR